MHRLSLCLGFLVEEEARVKGSSCPLPSSLLSCPFQTGPVRRDNNADYTRGGPEKSCPQVTAASTRHRMGPLGDSCIGARYNSKQRTKTYPKAVSLPSQLCPVAVLLWYAKYIHLKSLMLPDLHYNYQTPGNIKLHEGLPLTHLCTPSANNNTWGKY